ncbi:hypothetical protein C8J57DRAFT_1604736 [Mycena rebaudengoi]|nr:hypothetical protein C8J57DRAFT_1604736 [Mycena rebaudengoi]
MEPIPTFYDIPSTLPGNAYSNFNIGPYYHAAGNRSITRASPYKTIWLEYEEMEPISKSLGAAPTRNKPDGRPHYTLPMIHDPCTGAVVSESIKITEYYLDKVYPDTPRLLPAGTAAFQRVFEDGVAALAKAISGTREVLYGKTFEELAPKDELRPPHSSYIMGDTVSFADVWMVSYLK